jgi:antitoxin VapB
MHTETAKVFWNGRSQAIRLPKEFRFDDDEVCIFKENGRVILTPKTKMTWKTFFENFNSCDDFSIDRSNDAPQSRKLF